jgi:hypothetical protein
MPRQLIQCVRTGSRFTDKTEYVTHLRGLLRQMQTNPRGWKAYRSLRRSLLQLKRTAQHPDDLTSWLVDNQAALGALAGTTVMSRSEKDMCSGLYRRSGGDKTIVSCSIDDVVLCEAGQPHGYAGRPNVAAEVELTILTFARPRYSRALELLGLGCPCEASGWSRQQDSNPLSVTYRVTLNILEWPSLAAQYVWQRGSRTQCAAELELFSSIFPGIAWSTFCTLSESGFVPQKLTTFCQWLVKFSPRHGLHAVELPVDLQL